jgi:hypothetical protein
MSTGQCTTTNADVVCSVVIYFFGLERHLQLGQTFAALLAEQQACCI